MPSISEIVAAHIVVRPRPVPASIQPFTAEAVRASRPSLDTTNRVVDALRRRGFDIGQISPHSILVGGSPDLFRSTFLVDPVKSNEYWVWAGAADIPADLKDDVVDVVLPQPIKRFA